MALREQQEKFGPYYFGIEGEGEPAGAQGPSKGGSQFGATLSTPASPSAGKGPTTSGSFAPGSTALSMGRGLSPSARNTLGIISNFAPLTAPFTGPLGPLAGIVARGANLIDTLFGHQVQARPLGRGEEQGPPPAQPSPTGIDFGLLADLDAAAAAVAEASASSPDPSAGPTGTVGEASDYHKGGSVRRGPPKGPEVNARLKEKEFVVNAKAAKLHRGLLEAINKGASKAQLAEMMKGGR